MAITHLQPLIATTQPLRRPIQSSAISSSTPTAGIRTLQGKAAMEAQNPTIIIISLFLALSLFATSECQQQGGQWALIHRSIGISAMHMAVLPNNKLVIFDRTDFGRSNISLPDGKCRNDSNDQAVKYDCTAHSVELDLATAAIRPLMVLTDTWCSSGALSWNGTLIQTGGYNDGDHAVRYFSPCDGCDWVENKLGLTARRWYATDITLPDRRIMVVGGRDHYSYEFIPKDSSNDNAVFELPFLKQTKSPWAKKENNLYPFVYLAPDGNIFIFANNKSILLDYVNNKVVRAYPDLPGGFARNYPSTGSSVLLPLVVVDGDVRAEVMVCGGTVPRSNLFAENGTFLPAASSCGRLAIMEESAEWEMEEMPIGRTMGDMVMLPTGDVLIINGAMNGSAGWLMGRDPALSPVLYRTGVTSGDNRTFEVMTPSATPRLYHSTAVLVPDGRVLVGGSNPNQRYEFQGVMYPTDLSLEAFSPPYLQSVQARPNITSIGPGADFGYGDKMTIEFVASREIGEDWKGVDGLRVTMLAPAFNTHSFSMNQRLLVLEIEGVSPVSGLCYAADVSAPASATWAPPGYYLLFVVHDGIPSEGRWVVML